MTGQNTSSAVMQQRKEAHDSMEDFPTPPWATRALCEWLGGRLALEEMDAREPAANRGFMARVLQEYFGAVEAADQHDYGAGYPVQDYLFGPPPSKVWWTITNPPFRLAEKFIARALETSLDGVAMLVRTSFLEGQSRYAGLFKKHPPTHVLQFTERVVMHQGKMLDPDVPVRTWSKKLGEWVMRKPSTATSYCWLVWIRNSSGPSRIIWIPPCRKQLTKPGDYLLPEVLAA